ADIGELFLSGDVHVQVGGARVFTTEHALVDLRTGFEEQAATRLQMVQGISCGRTHAVRYEHAVDAAWDRPLPGHIAVKHLMHNASATRIGEELAAVADEAARGHAEFQAYAAMAVWCHTHHFAPPRAELLGDHPKVVFRTVDDHHFHRFVQCTSELFGD